MCSILIGCTPILKVARSFQKHDCAHVIHLTFYFRANFNFYTGSFNIVYRRRIFQFHHPRHPLRHDGLNRFFYEDLHFILLSFLILRSLLTYLLTIIVLIYPFSLLVKASIIYKNVFFVPKETFFALSTFRLCYCLCCCLGIVPRS